MNIQNTIETKVKEGFLALYNIEIPSVEFQATRKEFEGDITVVVFPLLRYKKGNPVQIGEDLGKYVVDFSDNTCQTQLRQARKDVKSQKLVYQISSFASPRYEDEREELLGHYGIDYINFGPNCTLYQEFYGYYMDSIIKKR